MTPGATGAARRPAPTGAPRSRTPERRPPLRVVERTRDRRRAPRPHVARRASTWISIALVAGSLLAVVAGDDLVTQGQIRLASVDGQLSTATATEKATEVAVAQLAAPTRVVRMAESEGLVATPQVTDLPEVPLDVPLPTPKTAPPASSSRR